MADVSINVNIPESVLEVIRGPQGVPGTDGQDGLNGLNGTDGVDGTNGADGKSAYQIWLDLGHTGSEADFIAFLKGPKGDDGEPGAPAIGGQPQDPAQFPTLLQEAFAADRPFEWGGPDVPLAQPVVLHATENKTGFSLNMNEAKILGNFASPAYALKVLIDGNGVNVREFSIKEIKFQALNSNMLGGLHLQCRNNNSWIYSFTLADITCGGHTEHAVWYDGSVFECEANRLKSTNGKGLLRATSYVGAPGGLALPSAMTGTDWRPRDFYGHAVQFDSNQDFNEPFDLRLDEGYFVTGLGTGMGIWAPAGLTEVEGVGFENLRGGAAMFIGYRGGRVIRCQGSNPYANASLEPPVGMAYLVKSYLAGGALQLEGCSVENYGGGSGMKLAHVVDDGNGSIILDPTRSNPTGADIDTTVSADRMRIVAYL